MTVTTSMAHVAADATAEHSTGAGFVTAALQSAKRTVLQFFRTPQLLMLGTIQGALFLFMFRYIFGGAIHPGEGIDYVDFLVPGFLVTGILWLGMPAAPGVAEDAATGVHDRLRSLPIPRSSVMIGRSLADAALALWGLFIAGVLAFIVGFRLHANVAEVVLALVLLVFAVYSFMWVFITIGLTVGQRPGGPGHRLAPGHSARIRVRRLRASRHAAGLDAARGRQPAVHRRQQRGAKPDPGRRRRRRSRAQHGLLGGAESCLVRRDPGGFQRDRRVPLRSPELADRPRHSMPTPIDGSAA